MKCVGMETGLGSKEPLKLSFQESSALLLVIACAGFPPFIKGKENVFFNATLGLQLYKVTPLLKKQTSFC